MEMIKVLFVCTGNICRSPTAEGVFRHLVASQGLDGMIKTDSAGTENYHIGDPPDPRTVSAAKQRGYILDDLLARQIQQADFTVFDIILAMDTGHYRSLQRICPPEHSHRIKMFLDFAANHPLQDVPDPYYGKADGFQLVLDMAEDGANGLLSHIRSHLIETDAKPKTRTQK